MAFVKVRFHGRLIEVSDTRFYFATQFGTIYSLNRDGFSALLAEGSVTGDVDPSLHGKKIQGKAKEAESVYRHTLPRRFADHHICMDEEQFTGYRDKQSIQDGIRAYRHALEALRNEKWEYLYNQSYLDEEG